MSLYWIHFDNDNVDSLKAYGPFENPEVMARFREVYADDEDEDGRRRSVDEMPTLPGTPEYDSHETCTWVPVQADSLFLLDGYGTYAVQEQQAFSVVNIETRAAPMLSD